MLLNTQSHNYTIRVDITQIQQRNRSTDTSYCNPNYSEPQESELRNYENPDGSRIDCPVRHDYSRIPPAPNSHAATVCAATAPPSAQR